MNSLPKIRIAHVTSVLGREGAGVRAVVEALSSHQLVAGHEVKVFGLDSIGWRNGDRESWEGAPATAYKVVGPRAFGYAPELATALTKFKPSIIHLHGLWTWPSIAAMQVSHRLLVPRVISPHGMLDAWALNQSRAKKRLALEVFERTNLNGSTIHALCASEAHSISSIGVKAPVAIIPNGVKLPQLNETPAYAPPWNGKLPEKSKVMLFLGRIHPKKGLPTLIDALADNREKIETGKWHLVVAGWDQEDHLSELKARATMRDISTHVHFVGPIFGASKSAALMKSHLFVLPSLSEGVPIAILEAWAHGLPVLMTPQCNLPEGILAGAAWEADPNPKSLAARLNDILDLTASELNTVGRMGARLVAEKYTWNVLEARFAELYASLI